MSDFQHVALPEYYDDDFIAHGYVVRVIGDSHLVLHDVAGGRLKPIDWDASTGTYSYLYDAMVAIAKYYRANKEPYPYHEEWAMMIDFIDHAYPHIDGPEGGREAPEYPVGVAAAAVNNLEDARDIVEQHDAPQIMEFI